MYSSIIKKPCKCGCGKMPTMGYGGYYARCNPAKTVEILDKQKKRQEDAMKGIGMKVVAAPQSREQTKSELLKEADKLFSEFIKRRDTDKNDNVYCPCCKQAFNLSEQEVLGFTIHTMHFVDRDVYSLRFDPDNAAAGHSWCNSNQHNKPTGKEYQNFKAHLINKFGIAAVAEMEAAKRKVNKITETQLKNIIEHYSTNDNQ